MLNYETILSSFDDKMTLMQWLKKVEEALNGASLTGVELKKKGNATFAWSFDFEDGTHIDTEYVTINEGDSVAEAYLLNGHLMIKLTNDEVIDAGNLKPVTSFSFDLQRHLIVNYGDGTTQDLGLIKGVSSFTIDTNQHLIVNYDNGTTQDLGAIFSGNININGNFTANSIIENMSGYSFVQGSQYQGVMTPTYISAVKNGNKVTFVWSFEYTRNTNSATYEELGYFRIPQDVADKIIPYISSSAVSALSLVAHTKSGNTFKQINAYIIKNTATTIQLVIPDITPLTAETIYCVRCEATFLLSNNLAGN